MQNNIKGVFVLKRAFGNNVSLFNVETKASTTENYFDFKNVLIRIYGIKRADNILDNINCYRKVLLDFNNNTAKLFVEKDADFNQVIKDYMKPENIAAEYENLFEIGDIEGKFQTF